MTQLFNRWLPAVTLAAWGAVALYVSSPGHGEYLADSFQRDARIAGFVLLGIAAVLAITRPDVACCRDAACSHGLGRSLGGKISAFAIIALPLVLLPFGSKQALADVQMKNRKEKQFNHISADMVQSHLAKRASQKASDEVAISAPLPGAIAPPPDLPLPVKAADQTPPPLAPLPPVPSQPPGVSYADAAKNPPPQPGVPMVTTPHPAAATPVTSFDQYFDRSPDGNIIVEVLDLVYAAQDAVLLKDFSDKRVELIVQYMNYSSKGMPGAPIRFKGVRMFMQCCTADARPVATLVQVDKLPDLPEMSWVKVTGIATFPIERGIRIPVLKAEKVEKTEPPAETMLQ